MRITNHCKDPHLTGETKTYGPATIERTTDGVKITNGSSSSSVSVWPGSYRPDDTTVAVFLMAGGGYEVSGASSNYALIINHGESKTIVGQAAYTDEEWTQVKALVKDGTLSTPIIAGDTMPLT